MFTINGKIWKIEYVRPSNPILQRSDKSWTVGVTDRNMQKIFVADTLRGDFERKVVTHEVCHACIFSYGIDMSLAQEEKLCDFVATYGAEIITIVDKVFQVLKMDKKS